MIRPSASPKLTLGIIGLGYWGEKLLKACQELDVPVIGTDADPKRRHYIQQTYPNIHWSPDTETILRDPGVDACIIATPPLTHFSLARDALQNNKHVLIEKPMTQDAEEASSLVRLAAMHKRILMVDHIYLFSVMVAEVKRMIQNNQLGKIQHINGNYYRQRGSMPDMAQWHGNTGCLPGDQICLSYVHQICIAHPATERRTHQNYAHPFFPKYRPPSHSYYGQGTRVYRYQNYRSDTQVMEKERTYNISVNQR